MVTATFPETSANTSTSCIALEDGASGRRDNTVHQGYVDTDVFNDGLGDAAILGEHCSDAIPTIMPRRVSRLLKSLSSRCRDRWRRCASGQTAGKCGQRGQIGWRTGQQSAHRYMAAAEWNHHNACSNLPRSLGTTTRLTEMMMEVLTHSSAGCVLLL
ncbi:hypothetical protein GE21DRAFT_1278288 [Neurospora crassa]|nr:hypothetical protein GE21DRAFT_1278288 [Neurospora crassa]